MYILPDRVVTQSTYLPRVNHDPICIIRAIENPHGHDVIQPVIVWVARLKDDAQVNQAVSLLWSLRLDEDTCTIVGLQVIACVREPLPVGVGKSPVSSEVANRAFQMMSLSLRVMGTRGRRTIELGTSEPAPRDGIGSTVAEGARAVVDGLVKGCVQRVEIRQPRRANWCHICRYLCLCLCLCQGKRQQEKSQTELHHDKMAETDDNFVPK